MTNSVILEGTLGQLKCFEKVAYLSLGIERNFTCDTTNAPHKLMVWINNNLVVFAPKVIEMAEDFVKKRVRLEGTITDNNYKDGSGQEIYQTQIVIHTITELPIESK